MYYIYRITNLINGKTYIGQHKYKDLNEYYMGSGKHLIRAQKKYGIENFKKEILVFNIPKEEQANILEKTFISSEREKVGRENCYNIADGSYGGGMKGRHFTEEHKRKLSKAHKGKIVSEETRKKLSDVHKGIQSPNKGRKFSEEHKKRLSEAHKGKPAWNKGMKMSEEYKKQCSETHKGRPAWNKGKSCTWLKGKPRTEEVKKKISDAKKGKHWFNDGKVNRYCYECPDGFIPGMLKK